MSDNNDSDCDCPDCALPYRLCRCDTFDCDCDSCNLIRDLETQIRKLKEENRELKARIVGT